ncbi:MAG: hypothetical protein CFE31_10940 [Rhizobiales bacterium PAR1]|nr:MAG: hypothetical protein CFE31_10940 [Rhizobiales bacterium PAR1]
MTLTKRELCARTVQGTALLLGLPGSQALAQASGTPRATSPLPHRTVERLSAYEMIDRMGTCVHLGYQRGGTDPYDLPNRNGEVELIRALQYLGIHHLRVKGLDDDRAANAASRYLDAPTAYQNVLTIREAIPDLKINFLIAANGPPHWADGSAKDPVVSLKKLAKMGVLSAIEAPNEPNNEPTFSPRGERYEQNVSAYNRVWQDWGAALKALKQSDPVFAKVPLLPPTSAVQGPNRADGVEATYADALLGDYSKFYDKMNIHAYSSRGGVNLADPMGPIENGMPPNFAAYQISITNWGRYAMPGRGVIITESGANTRKSSEPGHFPITEQAQGLVIVNNYFWAVYFGAERLFQYAIADDSTNLKDPDAERWGLYRGDWSAKPGADYVNRFTSVLADDKPSNPAALPSFEVTGKQPETWGATMAFSKSDGSYVIVANNTLSWWDLKTGRDTVPKPEKWTIRLAKESLYRVTDVLTGAVVGPLKGTRIEVPVRGYPMLVHVQPGTGPTRIE